MIEFFENKNGNLLLIQNQKSIEKKEVDMYKDAGVVQLNIQGIEQINYSAFKNWKSLKYIFLNDTEIISSAVFWGCCNLEKVQFGSQLRIIDYRAFANCKALKELVFPRTLTHIKQKAFEGCSSLEKINLSMGVQYIGHKAFASNYSDEDKKISSAILPWSLECIDSEAFAGKHIEYLEIPIGVRKHSTGAFSGLIVDRAEIFLADEDSPFNEFEDYTIPDTEFLWDLLSKEEV